KRAKNSRGAITSEYSRQSRRTARRQVSRFRGCGWRRVRPGRDRGAARAPDGGSRVLGVLISSYGLRCGVRKRGAGLQLDHRDQPALMTDLPLEADQAQGHRRLGVRARTAEAQLDVSGFDDASAAHSGERGQIGRHRERDADLLAGFQRDAGEADETDHRPGRLRDRVVQVELYDFGARTRPGVADGDLNGHFPVDGPLGGLYAVLAMPGHAGIAPLEGGVSEPE